jgi:hypothetical protein
VNDRPAGVTALSAFFVFGALMSLVSGLALLFPGSVLEAMWRLNPRAREGLGRLGPWGIVLMLSVSVACAFAAVGLRRGVAWGRRLAIGILLVNLAGDGLSALSGIEPRAAIGLPIGAGLVAYLRTRRVREFFGPGKRQQPVAVRPS